MLYNRNPSTQTELATILLRQMNEREQNFALRQPHLFFDGEYYSLDQRDIDNEFSTKPYILVNTLFDTVDNLFRYIAFVVE